MKKIIILIVSIFVFVGCFSSKAKVQKVPQKVLPSWYTSQKSNTNQYIYAIANGYDKEQAISRALVSIISQFSINIESSFESITTASRSKGSKYSNKSTSNIKTKIENIKINNYELIHSYPYRYNQYLVEIRVDKIKLNQFLKEDIKRKFDSLKNIENSIKDENFIVKLNTYEKLYNKAKSYENTLNIIKSMDKDFEINIYFDRIKKYYQKYLKIKNNFEIKIINLDKVKDFDKQLKKYLISKDIKIANTNVDLKIKIKINKQYINTQNYNIIVFNTTLQLFYKDKLIGNNTIEIKEFNTNKSKRIEQKASQKFFDDIQKQSFMNLFNISK